MAVNPIPEDYHSVTPYLKVRDASGLIDFLRQAFDAGDRGRMERPDGKIMHAEVRIGDSIVMLSDVAEGEAPMPATLNLYVEDVDATYRRALAAGATSMREPEDQFYGDRSGGVQDPFGNQWWISTHVEDVPPEEVQRRAEALAVQQG